MTRAATSSVDTIHVSILSVVAVLIARPMRRIAKSGGQEHGLWVELAYLPLWRW